MGLTGTIPRLLGNLSFLVTLDLSGNKFQGSLPQEIVYLHRLRVINLSFNNFTGQIPSWFSFLTCLKYLNLKKNNFTRLIPHSLFNLLKLENLILSSNSIQGIIPEEIGNLHSLKYVDIETNQLNDSIPSSVFNISTPETIALGHSPFGNLPTDVCLNLTKLKKLSSIPKAVGALCNLNIPSSTGGLQMLLTLSLAENKLQGSIPDSMGDLSNLVFLDLSNNNLSGLIPKSLVALQFLSYVNLSLNNLWGEIPSDGPFKNFTSQSFMSNGGLCGSTRFLVPPCSTSMGHKSTRKKTSHVIFITSGIGAALMAITLTIVFLMYRNKTEVGRTEGILEIRTVQRISYYELLQATHGYEKSNLLGTGSCGSVYKGILKDGMLVAVKMLNLQRLNRMIDVVRAIDYFHNGYLIPVIHCDLKPSNVLLDAEMVAHVLCNRGHVIDSLNIMDYHCRIWFGRTSIKEPNEGNFTGKLECVSLVMELAMHCTAKSPKERIGMKDALAALEKIKVQF
nr:LRR receptor-like serine/threonine-protein kinase FLS2 [Coffea arabica]